MALPEDAASEFNGLMDLVSTGEPIDQLIDEDLRLLVEAASYIRFSYIIRRVAQVTKDPQIGAAAFMPSGETKE